jgi:suppressor of ftsI
MAAVLLLPPHLTSAGPPVTSRAGACDGPRSGQQGDSPSVDLYCLELFPAAGIDAHGSAELRPAASPFGAAVTVDGTHAWDLLLILEGLPDPATLGPYTTYVAWAMPPVLDPVTRLGEVRNGQVRAGRIALDQFLLMVTAEASADVAERTGRLVLRGISASTRMQPHDLPFFLAGLLERRDSAGDVHAGHADHGMQGGDGWVAPPMHPQIQMPAALMTLRPDVGPFFPFDTEADAPPARPRELVRLTTGDTFDLTAAPVRKRLNGRSLTMLGFNGQIPGPLVQVDRGTTVVVRFHNQTTIPTTVHWHGIRLDNRFDGVPHVTQEPVAPGDRFDYTIHFPDAGIYWYHPHTREDALQDLGLYGNLMVRPDDPDWLGPVNREEFLVLDDLLLGDARLIPYGEGAPTHALMGRFGNLLLVNGEAGWHLDAARGEVVRLWLTNVSNTRVFNLSLSGARARMKVVASDLGRFEREEWVDNIVISPAERYVVDVRFEEAGSVNLLNRVRAIDHMWGRFFPEIDTLGTVRVGAAAAAPDHAAAFDELRTNQEVIEDIDRYRSHFARPADHTLHITVEPGALPFPLLPMMSMESVYRNPVEWSGTMPEMDWVATGRQTRWILRDAATGRENMDIDWRFRIGQVVKIRLVNDRDAVHAMQHPIHFHGQRFLVLSTNGVPSENLVWKDTALLPTGFVMDVLLEITNPGAWMIHCHIAEHIESGMHMVFRVEGQG